MVQLGCNLGWSLWGVIKLLKAYFHLFSINETIKVINPISTSRIISYYAMSMVINAEYKYQYDPSWILCAEPLYSTNL